MGKYAIFIVSALIFSLLTYSSALRNALFISNTRTVESHSINQAYNISESAMMVVINDIRSDPENSAFNPDEDSTYYYPSQNGFEDWVEMHGAYNIAATNQGDTLLTIQSTGRYDESRYRVNVGLVKTSGGGFVWPPINQGVHAEESITLTGSAKIFGDATINSTQQNSVSFDWGTYVSQNLFVGPGGNPEEVAPNVSQWSPNQVHGERHTMEEELEYPLPEFPESPNSISTGQSFRLTNYAEEQAKTTYNYSEFEGRLIDEVIITGDRTMTIDVGNGDRTLHVRNFNIPQGHINIEGEGSLTIYVDENFNFSSGGGDSSINKNGDPNQLTVLYNGQQKVQFGGNTRFFGNLYIKNANMDLPGSSEIHGNVISGGQEVKITGGASSVAKVIYAPNSDVRLEGSGHVYGSIIADTYYASGGGAHLYYDNELPADLPDLPGSGGAPTFTVSYWN